MSTAPPSQLDLTTPPIIKVIQRRSLAIGGGASLIALYLAFTNPTVFFQGYLLSYMDWLGVCLGSMAIVMVRHMTGGGWGTVIRRILEVVGCAFAPQPTRTRSLEPSRVRRDLPWAFLSLKIPSPPRLLSRQPTESHGPNPG